MLSQSIARTRNIQSVQRSLRWFHSCSASRKFPSLQRRLFLGAGASTIFALYCEVSLAFNDTEEKERTSDKFSRSSSVSTRFEDDLRQQNMFAPDWTDNGIYRVDIAAVAANMPIEDVSSYYTSSFSPKIRYTFFGVFDGHNGGSTARKLASDLPEAVCLHLADLYSKHASPECNPEEPPDPRPPSDEVHAAIKAAFLEVDDLIVNEAARQVLGISEPEYHALNGGKEFPASAEASPAKPPMSRSEGMKILKEAYSGSCAILGIYNNFERTLHVALTGDLRAVLGRRVLAPKQVDQEKGTGHTSSTTNHDDQTYSYQVLPLSVDQNATNPKEAERLTALHPDEPELLKKDRVLGWGPARAFGDGSMKWSVAVQKRLSAEYLADWPRTDVLKTPPYFTAEPEVTKFEGVRRGAFLILASDGLWDSLTSEEVVGLVGRWLEERGMKEKIGRGATAEVMMPKKIYPSTTIGLPTTLHEPKNKESVSGNDNSYGPNELPVTYPDEYKDKTLMFNYWRTSKRFISSPDDESNAAKHVIRNALGGADRSLSEALYMMEGSKRRRYRDDITVQVIFFE